MLEHGRPPLRDRGTPLRRLLLVSHTHHDLGYTNSPRLIDRHHADIVARVLDLIDETPDDSDPIAFRWTFEVARPVLRFAALAGAGGVARLADACARGRAAVTGGYYNMTQLPDSPELDAAYRAVTALREAGIEVRTEQHGDINGLGWGTVPEMRRHGLSRLLMALNPDHGWPPFPQPSVVRWEGPDGSRVLTFLSTHYGWGEPWELLDGDFEAAESSIEEFARDLSARDDWPFDFGLLHAANDNRWPDLAHLGAVRRWNQAHPDLPIRTVTVDQLFDLIEPAADVVPTVRGEWADWWAHGHGSTAREVSVARDARGRLRGAHFLLGMDALRGPGATELATVLGFHRGPHRLRSPEELAADLDGATDDLLCFMEHTWGGWDTHSFPHGDNVASQWNACAALAWRGWEDSRSLATEGLFRYVADRDSPGVGPAGHPRRPGADGTQNRGENLVVVNPTAHDRGEPVWVRVDDAGEARPVWVDVPAFGQSVVPIDPPATASGTGWTLSSPEYAVTLDPRCGGASSIIDRRSGVDLLQPSQAWGTAGLGALVQEMQTGGEGLGFLEQARTLGTHTDNPVLLPVVSRIEGVPDILDAEHYRAIRWRQRPEHAAGNPQWRRQGHEPIDVVCTLRLYPGHPDIDLDVEVVKPEVEQVESLHVAFPFAVAESARPEFLLQTQGAVFIAGQEQLESSCHDWYSIQQAVGLRDAGGERGIRWLSLDAPLVQLDGFHTGAWARRHVPVTGMLSSWIMNNWYPTNFRASQGGWHRFRYRFSPGEVTPRSIRVLGDDAGKPLQARQLRGAWQPPACELVIEPGDAVIADADALPLRNGMRLTVRSLSAHPQQLDIGWQSRRSSLAMAPFEVRCIDLVRTAGGVDIRVEPGRGIPR